MERVSVMAEESLALIPIVRKRVWIVEFEDNYASKNREEIRTEF